MNALDERFPLRHFLLERGIQTVYGACSVPKETSSPWNPILPFLIGSLLHTNANPYRMQSPVSNAHVLLAPRG